MNTKNLQGAGANNSNTASTAGASPVDLVSQFTTSGDQVVVSSRVVADRFEIKHGDLMQKVIGMKLADPEVGAKLRPLIFESTYRDAQNKERPEYLLTRDGFSFIVMGLTGRKADLWKLKFIDAFNAMEQKLKEQYARPSYQIEDPIERAQKWIEEEKERQILLEENNDQKHIIHQQSDMIDVLLPKAKAFEDEMSTDGWYSGSVAAKIIYGNQSSMGRNNLYKFLRKKGVLLKNEEHNMPVDTYVKKGWMKTVWIYDEHKKKAVPTPLFSKKGIKEIHNMIIQDVCPMEDLFY